MDLKKLLTAGLLVTATLTNTALSGPQKLEQLTDNYAEVVENVDDLVSALPWGIGLVAKLVVDNPPVDAWQREMIAKPLAEMTYQVWTVVNGEIVKLSEFAQRIVKPALAVIHALSSNEALTNEQRRERLQAYVHELLSGVLRLTELLPGGIREFAALFVQGKFVQDALESISAFLGEVLYQVWKALHPNQQALAIA